MADLEEYATRWRRQAEAGQDVNGEADLVASLGPTTVLDAGCGAGRVAIELAGRGIDVVGVDLDEDLLAHARRLAPDLDWRHQDLASLDLGRRFDVIVQAGSVLNFCRPDDRASVVARAAEHLEPGGHLVSGFAVEPEEGSGTRTNLDLVLEVAGAVGLTDAGRWATWDRRPSGPDDGYVVVMLRRSDRTERT